MGGTATGSLARVHRPELQGLRAVAVTLVVVYHVWFGRVSGGVDVFFVVSGFLLTGQLARDRRPRAAGAGPAVEPHARSAAAVRRRRPGGTVVAGMLLLPEGRWQQTLQRGRRGGGVPGELAARRGRGRLRGAQQHVSPVQHFWSLSIQGQFFLVWPLLVALVALAARGEPTRVRAHLTVTTPGCSPPR